MRACATPAVLGPVLARLEGDAAAHYGVESLRLVPLEYHDRPFSHLLRVAVLPESTDDPLSHLFVKVTKAKVIAGGPDAMRERVTRDYDTTRRLHSAMSAYPNLGVVPPVACYPEHLAIVTEEVAGPTLQQYLTSQAAWFPSRTTVAGLAATLRTVGEWIQAFQSSDPSTNYIQLGEIREYLDHRLQRLVSSDRARFTAATRHEVLEHFDSLASVVDRSELRETPVHSDLALGNVLVSGGRIVVLDFGMTKTGCALTDLTRLFVQLELLVVKPQISAAVIRRLQSELLAGYDLRLSADRPLFRLLVLRHRVNHLLTLLFDRSSLAASIYNRFVCRNHYHWIAGELARPHQAILGD